MGEEGGAGWLCRLTDGWSCSSGSRDREISVRRGLAGSRARSRRRATGGATGGEGPRGRLFPPPGRRSRSAEALRGCVGSSVRYQGGPVPAADSAAVA